MRALIVGGGEVGSTLAARLSRVGHDVVVVEQSAAKLVALADRLDVQTVAGNGTTVDTLRRAGIEACDILFACTSSDEANMVTALVGSTIFRVPRVVARLREADHEASFRVLADRLPGEHLCLNPDMAAVNKILSLLPVPGAVDVASFLDGRLFIAGFPIAATSDLAGLLLSHLRLLFPAAPVLAVAIRRGEQWLIPHGTDEIRAGDQLYLALDPAELENVLDLLHARRGQERRVHIAGATRIGLALAKRLETSRYDVTIFDNDEERCASAAGLLSHATVIHASATDSERLEEEGIGRVSAFMAVSDNPQLNVVAALLARRLGAARTFALVDDPVLSALVGELGIDAVISPRLLTVGLAVQFFRRGQVRAAAALMEDVIEIIEVEVPQGGPLARAPLASLGLPRGALVAAILRGERLIVPRGDDALLPGDRALLITTTERAAALDQFLVA